MISRSKQLYKSCFFRLVRINKQGYGDIPEEFQELGEGVRLGEIKGVRKDAIDGCIVCSSTLGPNTHLPEWYNLWLLNHDTYDEEVKPPATMRTFAYNYSCPNGYGKRCGKYCCSDHELFHTR